METFVKPHVGSRREDARRRRGTSRRRSSRRTRAHLRARVDLRRTRRADSRRPAISSPSRRAGESLIVTRDAAGVVHAFFNVCRHRGTRICEQHSPGVFTGSIQCPYHAWTYGLDGELKVARNMTEVSGLRPRATIRSKRPRVGLWEGFIFVNLTLRRRDSVRRALRAADRPLRRAGTSAACAPRAASRYELACNWKLVFMNYSECYHCPLVHPQLDKLSPSDSGRNDLSEGPFLGGYSELREHGTSLTMTRAHARGRRSERSTASNSIASTTTRSFRRCC